MITDVFEALLAQQAAETRAERVHASLRQLSESISAQRLLFAELIYEIHQTGYWNVLRDEDGAAYPNELAYFHAVTGGYEARAHAYYLALGRFIRRFPLGQRNWLRNALTPLGISKAIQLSRLIITDVAAIQPWLARAAREDVRMLHASITEALGTQRGEHSGDRCSLCGRRMSKRKAAKAIA